MANEKEIPALGSQGPQTSDTNFARTANAIVGSPTGFRFATGRENVDVRSAGVEMLRSKHAPGERDGS